MLDDEERSRKKKIEVWGFRHGRGSPAPSREVLISLTSVSLLFLLLSIDVYTNI